jgi:hypothetical protein
MSQITAPVQSASELAGFAPARAILVGKTKTEAKIALIHSASAATSLYLASEKGKVGQAARANVSAMGANKMVREVRMGNYRSAAESLAVLLGESVVISNRASWESIEDRFEGMLAGLKNEGYKDGKPVAKRVAIERAMALVGGIKVGVEELLRMEAEEKARREAETQGEKGAQ